MNCGDEGLRYLFMSKMLTQAPFKPLHSVGLLSIQKREGNMKRIKDIDAHIP